MSIASCAFLYSHESYPHIVAVGYLSSYTLIVLMDQIVHSCFSLFLIINVFLSMKFVCVRLHIWFFAPVTVVRSWIWMAALWIIISFRTIYCGCFASFPAHDLVLFFCASVDTLCFIHVYIESICLAYMYIYAIWQLKFFWLALNSCFLLCFKTGHYVVYRYLQWGRICVLQKRNMLKQKMIWSHSKVLDRS